MNAEVAPKPGVVHKPEVVHKRKLLNLVRSTTFGLLFLVALIGLVSFGVMQKLHDQVLANEHSYLIQQKVVEFEEAVTEAETGQRGYMLTGQQRYLDPYTSNAELVLGLLNELQSMIADDAAERSLVGDLETASRSKLNELARTVDLRRAGKVKEALDIVMSDDGKILMDKIRSEIRKIKDLEKLRMTASQADRDTWLARASALTLGGMLACVAVGTLSSVGISRRLEPLTGCAEVAEKIGNGDLSPSAVPIIADDEIGQVSLNLNLMSERLRQMLRETRSAAENLGAATQQILASAREQSAGTQAQAAALQQTTATMEEISQSASQIAERSRQIASTSESTSAASVAGLEAVQKTVTAMDGIRRQAETMADNILAVSEKTHAISDIVVTVNEIAERSNLLALNAAIEAAAVGEAGRSFGVVATEMKSLADQCKEATVQVRSILTEIQKGIHRSVLLTEEAVKRVDAGMESNQRSDQTIRRLVSSVEDNVRVFQQIVAATNQQMIGFEQVTMALLSIRQATDNSAIGTRQLETAASNLSNLGEQLRKTTSSYRLE